MTRSKRVLDLEKRLRISIAVEREAEARSTKQSTSFAEFSTRFEQQQTSNRFNEERMMQCLHLHHWTEAEIHKLMSQAVIIVGCTGGQHAASRQRHELR